MSIRLRNTRAKIEISICIILLLMLCVFAYQSFADSVSNVNHDVARMIEHSKGIEAEGNHNAKEIIDKSSGVGSTSNLDTAVQTMINTSKEAMNTHGSSGMLPDKSLKQSSEDKGNNNLQNNDEYQGYKYQRYIFISTSMPKQALKEIFANANSQNALIVLRGFRNNSYRETHNYFSKLIKDTETGFVIDPELFKTYGIESVPTFIISKQQECAGEQCMTPIHDRIIGNVGIHYAFESLAKDGELTKVIIKQEGVL